MDAQSRQQEETKNINVSLHTFGKVINFMIEYLPRLRRMLSGLHVWYILVLAAHDA